MATQLKHHVKRLDDRDADLGVLARTLVSVCGRGGEAIPLALCLRDSGVQVQVVLPAGEPGRDQAQAWADEEGLPSVASLAGSPSPGWESLVLTTGAHQPHLLATVDPQLLREAVVVATLPPAVGQPAFDPGLVDAFLVPQAPPRQIRRRFCDGAGVGALMALIQQGDRRIEQMVVALARALGLTRAGVLLTTTHALRDSWALSWATVGLAGLGGLVGASVAVQKQMRVPAPVAMMSTATALRQAVDVFTAAGALPAAKSDTSAWGEAEHLRHQVQQWWRTHQGGNQQDE